MALEITEGSDDLERRIAIGAACIAEARGEGTDDDPETYGSDAISNILTAIFGPYGAYNSDNGDFVQSESVNQEVVMEFLRGCLESYMGDSEDYDVARPE